MPGLLGSLISVSSWNGNVGAAGALFFGNVIVSSGGGGVTLGAHNRKYPVGITLRAYPTDGSRKYPVA